MRVLVLGARAPVALDHARRFASQGWQAFVADSISCRVSAWSHSISGAFRLPPPRYALRQFRQELARLIEQHQIDLLLPTCEESFYVSAVRPQLPKECLVFVAPFEQMHQLHSKARFLELATDCGIPVPKSSVVASLDAARDWAGGRAVVLKPEYSRFGVYVRIYQDGIPQKAESLPFSARWIVQELMTGLELCSYTIAVDGRITAHVVYEPTYRLRRSSSYYFEPRSVPQITTAIAKIVGTLRYTGQISFDWIVSPTGVVVPLECNPRAVSGLHLYLDDEPLPEAILGRVCAAVSPRHDLPAMLAPAMLLFGLPAALRSGTWRRWNMDWHRARDVLTRPCDWGPTPGVFADFSAFGASALRHGCSVRAAATRDSEWDGEELHT